MLLLRQGLLLLPTGGSPLRRTTVTTTTTTTTCTTTPTSMTTTATAARALLRVDRSSRLSERGRRGDRSRNVSERALGGGTAVKDRDCRRTARLSDSALASLDLGEGIDKGGEGEVTRVLAKEVIASSGEAV
ncbi:hypothetical protein CLOM_g11147 [Closterium sp. NIES-68]|nr:hypothetical protein CLOM_g11147 [Closterium sp. NIES-68]